MGQQKTKVGFGSVANPEVLLEGLFEHSPVAFQIYRADGHSLAVNQAFRDLFLSEPPPEYNVLEDDVLKANGFLALVQRAFAGETIHVPPHWYEPGDLLRLEVREGRKVGIEVTLFPLRGVDGAIEHIALCAKDTTSELKLREVTDALRRSQDELAATLQSIGDAVIVTDARGRVTGMNPVAENLTGWPVAEAMGRSVDDIFRIIDEQNRTPVDPPLQRVIREGTVVGLANKMVLVARGGTERAIADCGATIRDREGNVLGMVLVFRDKTEERRAERALRESEARKSAVLESALDCIVTMDQDGLIIEFNPAAEKTFGYARSEVLGKPLADLMIPPSLRQSHREGLRRYLAGGAGRVLGKRLELPAMRADGSEFPVELTVSRLSSYGPPMFTGFIRDLTEQRRVERALLRSQGLFRRLDESGIIAIITADFQGTF